jgi:hypothetical protein
MNDIGYKEILYAIRIELQPTSRLQDIDDHDVSHSHNPRAESVSEACQKSRALVGRVPLGSCASGI